MSVILIITSFSINDLLGEIIEHYLQQDNFLETLMPTLNKKPLKNKASMLKIDVSCFFHSPRGAFRTLLSI